MKRRMTRQFVARLVFLGALGGGLLLWSQQRRPRDLTLQIDLTGALPGEIVEVDVVVRRSGHALARHDVRYGESGAPGLLELPVRAFPGSAEGETTPGFAGKTSGTNESSV